MDLRKLKKLIDLVEESGIAEIEVTGRRQSPRNPHLCRPCCHLRSPSACLRSACCSPCYCCCQRSRCASSGRCQCLEIA